MMSSSRPLAYLVVAALLAAALQAGGLLGCSSELEVKGNTTRVIGEHVTLALVEGDESLSGELTLTDARGGEQPGSALGVQQVDDRTLDFVIPPATAAGPATLRAKQKGGGAYAVPLSISRLAAALDAQGNLELLPLPPSTLASSKQAVDASGQQLSMAPGGGMVLTLGSDKVRFFQLSKDAPKEVASLLLANSTCIAALPSGVIVATSVSIQIYRYTEGKGIEQGGSLTLKNTQALAVGQDGQRAAALVQCDTNGDSLPDKDCVVSIDLGGASPVKGPQVELDAAPGAKLLAVRANGLGAVIADGDKIHGVDFTAAPPKLTTINWNGAKAIGLAHATTVIQSQENDLFAIADENSKTIRMVGFQGATLAEIDSTITLDVVPTQLAFGRSTDLYVVAANRLLEVDASRKDAPAVPLSQQLTQTPVSFVVQP